MVITYWAGKHVTEADIIRVCRQNYVDKRICGFCDPLEFLN